MMALNQTARHAFVRAAPFLLLTLVGCQVVNPGVEQLDRYQKARDAGQWQVIADDAPINKCQPVVEGCARLYAMYGEANQHLAFASLAPNAFCPPPEANGRLNTAAASFAKSEQFGDASLSADAKTNIQHLHAQALYCLAENSSSVEQGTALVRQSAREAAALPRPAALFWQAMSQLYLARPGAGSDAQRCAAARSAGDAARAARSAGVNGEQSQTLGRVSHDASQLRRLIAGCAE